MNLTPEQIAEIEVAALVATPTGKREWVEGPPAGVPATSGGISSAPGGTVFVRTEPYTIIVAEYTHSLANAALIAKLDPETAAELCRLARLGLRVEGAPNRLALFSGTGLDDDPLRCRIHNIVPDDWEGKRVALVVVE